MKLRRILSIFILAILMSLLFAFPAMAQDGSSIEIPYIAQIIGVIVSVFALVSVIIPDSKMPPIVKQIVNFLALNFGNARNDPAQDGGS